MRRRLGSAPRSNAGGVWDAMRDVSMSTTILAPDRVTACQSSVADQAISRVLASPEPSTRVPTDDPLWLISVKVCSTGKRSVSPPEITSSCASALNPITQFASLERASPGILLPEPDFKSSCHEFSHSGSSVMRANESVDAQSAAPTSPEITASVESVLSPDADHTSSIAPILTESGLDV